MAWDSSLFGYTRPWLHLLYRFDIDLAGYCYWTFISVKWMRKTCNTRKNFSNRRFWSLAIFWFHNGFHGKICEQHQRQRLKKMRVLTIWSTIPWLWTLWENFDLWKVSTNIENSTMNYCSSQISPEAAVFSNIVWFYVPSLAVSNFWLISYRNARTEKNRNQKIGCKIANNRILSHHSRKRENRKNQNKLRIYFYYYSNRNQPICVRFFGCEF